MEPISDPQIYARLLVAQYFNLKAEKTDNETIDHLEDVYVVWFCYILGGWKALVSTTVVDGMYYEVTCDKARGKVYVDAYKKWENVEVDYGNDLE